MNRENASIGRISRGAMLLAAGWVGFGAPLNAAPVRPQNLRFHSATVTIGACDSLAPVGQWELVTPPQVPAGKKTNALLLDPYNPGTVFLGAENRGILKSVDCGSTWTQISTGRNSSSVNSGEPMSMQMDPRNNQVIYTTSFQGAGGLWKSVNGGVDWDPLFPPGSEVASVVQFNFISNVSMEAANPDHLVVTMHADCVSPNYGPVCEAESTDGGATWTITTVDIGAGSYVQGAGAFILDATTWLFSTYAQGLWLTTDRGHTWTEVTPAGANGVTSGKPQNLPFAPSPAGNYFLGSYQGVLKSVDGRSWTLLPNSGGRTVGLVLGEGGRVYSADQWAPNYHVAFENDLSTWQSVPSPAGLPSDKGALYLAYDAAHHVLYSSNFEGGFWRMRTQ